MFAALKPGGSYVIVDHAARGGIGPDEVASLHRVDRDQVISEVKAAGFRLAEEGRFLHRPGDDHTLPVTDLRVRGMTDQFALRFVKPAR